MNSKILLKYILMYIPFVLGVVMYSFNIVNLVSSLLLFVGGYVAIKNTLDYRIIRKNQKKYKIESIKAEQKNLNNREIMDVSRKNKIKRNIIVRKREKK